MALELPLPNPYGDDYPNAYRRLELLVVNCRRKEILATFGNYKDAESAAISDDLTTPKEPFSKTSYRIGPDPVPAVLAEDGKTEIEPAIPSYDQFKQADDASSTGISATVYGYVKTRPDNAGARDV